MKKEVFVSQLTVKPVSGEFCPCLHRVTLQPLNPSNISFTTLPPSPPGCLPPSLPENCRAKPCLLVKKSVVNCRLTVLKVLWASGGSTEPLSSLNRTPPSWGPSQIRSTSWTSSVWKTRKCRLLKARTTYFRDHDSSVDRWHSDATSGTQKDIYFLTEKFRLALTIHTCYLHASYKPRSRSF